MPTTVDAQVPLTSNAADPVVGIGEAARRTGLAPSAIRYYESEGLLDPRKGPDGRRRYGPQELRVLAFVAVGRDLGIGIAAIRTALHPGTEGWARTIDDQLTLLDAQIAKAARTRAVLLAGRDCPAPAPVRDCSHLRNALDTLLAGPPDARTPAVGVPHLSGHSARNAAANGSRCKPDDHPLP
jgi:MerR family redox-sensitive transcriptional activator SoxR